jgi:peptidoglycan hydrolase-like protein with peptidoglycan-binding domain
MTPNATTRDVSSEADVRQLRRLQQNDTYAAEREKFRQLWHCTCRVGEPTPMTPNATTRDVSCEADVRQLRRLQQNDTYAAERKNSGSRGIELQCGTCRMVEPTTVMPNYKHHPNVSSAADVRQLRRLQQQNMCAAERKNSADSRNIVHASWESQLQGFICHHQDVSSAADVWQLRLRHIFCAYR